MNDEPKVFCETPTPKRKGVRIPKWKYEVVRRAILNVVSDDDEGVLFNKLPVLVAGKLTQEERLELGSISWHTTTVKLDLETKGEIERVPGSKPQRIRKVRG